MGFTITKGYKLGRAVSFYDIEDVLNNKKLVKVKKDEIVRMCEAGEIENAKIQWWQGAPIVRLKSDNIPIERTDDSGNNLGEVQRVTKNIHPSTQTNPATAVSTSHTTPSNKPYTVSKETATEITVGLNARVVGKLSNKPKKNNISFNAGYDYKNVTDQIALSNQIDYKKMQTIDDLFDTIATDFHADKADEYKKSVSKSIKLDKKLSSMSNSEIGAVQSTIATYLMNMVYDEISQKYIKYFARTSSNTESID